MAPRVSSGTPLWRPISRSSVDDRMRGGKSRCDVAIAFAHDSGFGRMAGVELAGRRIGGEEFGQWLDLDRHQIGGVLGDVGVAREHDSDRLADIAHAIRGKDRLAVRIKPFDAGEPEIDRRNFGDIGCGPYRGDARRRARRGGVDGDDAAMRVRGTNDAHVQLMRERNVGGEAALAGDQRKVLEARDRAADEAHRALAGLRRGVIARLAQQRWRRGAGFRSSAHANRSAGDVDLVEAAWLLREPPIGRQRQIEKSQQERPVYAVVADQHDGLVGMPRQHHAHRIGGAGGEILQRFPVRENAPAVASQTTRRTARDFALSHR